MCYDVSFTINFKQLSDYFPELIFDDQIKMDFEPTHIVGHDYGLHPIIYRHRDDNQLHCRLMEWGCIPYYVKDADKFIRRRATMLNARSERILEDKGSYWYKIRNRRCVIPVTGIYEHRRIESWAKSAKKVPYHIQLKDQPMFFLPGLYSVAELPDKNTGEMHKVHTYTLITRPANALMKQIHNDGENKWRMPLFLPFELSQKWLLDDLSDEEYKEILEFEMPAQDLIPTPVYTIRSPKERPDGKAKNEFYEWDKLPDLIG